MSDTGYDALSLETQAALTGRASTLTPEQVTS